MKLRLGKRFGGHVLLASALVMLGCGGDEAPGTTPSQESTAGSATALEDLDRVEHHVARFLVDLEQTWGRGLREGRTDWILNSASAAFQGTGYALGEGSQAKGVQGILLDPDGQGRDAESFAQWLLTEGSQPAPTWERVQLEIEGCTIHEEGEGAAPTAGAELLLRVTRGGRYEDGRAVFVEGHFEVTATEELKGWFLERAHWTGGRRLVTNQPTFRDRTRSAGLVERTRPDQIDALQTFIDQRETLSLSSLIALDWNRDGFPDLISTREAQDAVLYLNDGSSGFLPMPLPLESPGDASRGLLWLDLDGDGWEELVPTRVMGYAGQQAWLDLWTREDGSWTRKPKALVFPNPVGQRRVSIQALVPIDAQGDGLVELFAPVYGNMNSRGPNYNTVLAHDGGFNPFFQNLGQLTFREAAQESGFDGTQYSFVAYAFDFDGDGDQDLWEGNDFGPNILWSNDGEGAFRRTPSSPLVAGSTYTMGVTLADYDQSGAWSLYISNMSSPAGKRLAPLIPGVSDASRQRVAGIAAGNMLFRADEGWRQDPRGLDDSRWAWGCVFFDLENDGDHDLVVTNGFTSHRDRELPDWDTWFWRQVAADAGFLERGEATQLLKDGGFQGSYAGYQHDRMYLQTEAGAFFDAAYALGLDLAHDGRAVIPVDVDGDGDLDLVYQHLLGLRLLENTSPARSFLRLKLEGRPPATHALGATITVEAGGRTWRERVRLIEGFHSQLPRTVHVGLGDVSRVEGLTVRWPDGEEHTFEDLPTDVLVEVEQESGALQSSPLPRWSAGFVDVSTSQEAAEPGRFLLVLPEAFPLPENLPEELMVQRDPGATALMLYSPRGELVRAFAVPPAPTTLLDLIGHYSTPPEHPDVLVRSGREDLAQGRLRPAQAKFQKAVEAAPADAFAWEALGEALYEARQPQQALQAYERALAIDPDYGLAHYNRGIVYAEQGAFGPARQALAEACRLLPERYEVHLAAGETAALAGQTQEAKERLLRAASLNESAAAPLVLLGKLHGLAGDFAAAVQAFEEALERNPKDPEARPGLQRARTLLEQSQRR